MDVLSRQAGASIRTLRYAFRELFGVSPKEYLQAYRLNQVRNRLSNANPLTVRVSDIANEFGFLHLGQFAKNYRKMFAELPSVTLARKIAGHVFDTSIRMVDVHVDHKASKWDQIRQPTISNGMIWHLR